MNLDILHLWEAPSLSPSGAGFVKKSFLRPNMLLTGGQPSSPKRVSANIVLLIEYADHPQTRALLKREVK